MTVYFLARARIGNHNMIFPTGNKSDPKHVRTYTRIHAVRSWSSAHYRKRNEWNCGPHFSNSFHRLRAFKEARLQCDARR
jgi:hypothetical protein